jgi:hypothetical protein
MESTPQLWALFTLTFGHVFKSDTLFGEDVACSSWYMSVTPLPVQSDYHATMQPPILLSRANRELPLRNSTFIQHCHLRPVGFCQYAEDTIRVIRWSRAGGTLKRTRFITPKCTSSRQCCCFPFTPTQYPVSVNKSRQRARGFGSNQNRTEDFLHEAISLTPENCSLAANSPLDRTPLSPQQPLGRVTASEAISLY